MASSCLRTRTPPRCPQKPCRHAISTAYVGRPRAGAAPGRAFVRLAQPGHRSDTIVADGHSQHNGARQRSASGRAACESDRPALFGRIHLAINPESGGATQASPTADPSPGELHNGRAHEAVAPRTIHHWPATRACHDRGSTSRMISCRSRSAAWRCSARSSAGSWIFGLVMTSIVVPSVTRVSERMDDDRGRDMRNRRLGADVSLCSPRTAAAGHQADGRARVYGAQCGVRTRCSTSSPAGGGPVCTPSVS